MAFFTFRKKFFFSYLCKTRSTNQLRLYRPCT